MEWCSHIKECLFCLCHGVVFSHKAVPILPVPWSGAMLHSCTHTHTHIHIHTHTYTYTHTLTSTLDILFVSNKKRHLFLQPARQPGTDSRQKLQQAAR